MRTVLLVLAVGALGLAPPVAAQLSDAEVMERGRRYTAWFYAGHADSLWAATSAAARARGSAEAFDLKRSDVVARAGTEVAVMHESVRERHGRREYWRTARFSSASEPLLVRWIFDETGAIFAAGFTPISQAPPTPD